jgi:formiminotetrahydrofolate cyclodeaminase
LRSIFFVSAALMAGSACAQVQNLPPEQKKEFNEIAMGFVMADECSKRHNMPQLFKTATEAFRKVAMKHNMPNATAEVDKAARDIQAQPLSKAGDGFTLATKEACTKLDQRLGDYLEK